MSVYPAVLTLLIGASLLLQLKPAAAQELTAVKVIPASAGVGEQVAIEFDFKLSQGDNPARVCGLLVDFGDGSTQHFRVDLTKLPFSVTRSYEQAGPISISASGKTQFQGLNTSFGCSGNSRSTALVVRMDDYAAKEAEAVAARKAALARAQNDRNAAQSEAANASNDRANAQSDRAAAQRAAQKAREDKLAADKAAADQRAASRPPAPAPAFVQPGARPQSQQPAIAPPAPAPSPTGPAVAPKPKPTAKSVNDL